MSSLLLKLIPVKFQSNCSVFVHFGQRSAKCELARWRTIQYFGQDVNPARVLGIVIEGDALGQLVGADHLIVDSPAQLEGVLIEALK